MRARRGNLRWLILALNVTAGAALVSVASPLAQELTRVTAGEAALAVIALSLCNGAGRILWGWASDRLRRPATFAVLFALQFVPFALLAPVRNFPMLVALAGGLRLGFR